MDFFNFLQPLINLTPDPPVIFPWPLDFFWELCYRV